MYMQTESGVERRAVGHQNMAPPLAPITMTPVTETNSNEGDPFVCKTDSKPTRNCKPPASVGHCRETHPCQVRHCTSLNGRQWFHCVPVSPDTARHCISFWSTPLAFPLLLNYFMTHSSGHSCLSFLSLGDDGQSSAFSRLVINPVAVILLSSGQLRLE